MEFEHTGALVCRPTSVALGKGRRNDCGEKRGGQNQHGRHGVLKRFHDDEPEFRQIGARMSTRLCLVHGSSNEPGLCLVHGSSNSVSSDAIGGAGLQAGMCRCTVLPRSVSREPGSPVQTGSLA